jgi:antitoxin MazE
VIITPVADAPVTLEQRLARYDPARHGGEAMVSAAVGAERW